MAKILAPYVLCPLPERRRFVGVSQDSESGCMIVTLARNIVIRYRLLDQKQVSSWSTKALLSAPVIYDHASKLYYGIFNSEDVSSWEEHVLSLGKLNKTKFCWLIHSIVSSEDCSAVIVYQNGFIGALKTCLATSKEPPNVDDDQLIPSNQTVKDARLVSLASVHYVAIYTSSDDGDKSLYFMPVDQDRGTRFSVNLFRETGVTLTTYTILDGDSPELVTLWSNGELYFLELPIKNKFPGKFISRVRCINPTLPAVLLPLGEEHLVLYGAAPNSEGAHLVILSRKFALPESTTKMKVFDEECRMWTCRNNIVLVHGGHLVVAPFRLDTVKLVSLLGVDKPPMTDDPVVETYSSFDDRSPSVIVSRINTMKELGKTEYCICDIVLEELLESRNPEGVMKALDCISDIPDKWLVRIASFALDCNDENLLKKVLRLPITGDNATLTLVRQKMMLTSALKLMSIVTNMLKDDDMDKCVLDWASLLCDSHYLQCLLSKDEQVVATISDLKDAVEEHVDSMVTYRSLLAEINYFKRGKVTSKTPSVPSSHSYVVEKIKLY